MAAADKDSYAAIVNDLLGLYPELMGGAPVRKATGFVRVAHLAHGWYLRCHRGAEAIGILDREGYAEEASPIRRSIIEHVVALKWLAAEGDKVADTVARGYANDVESRRKAVEGAGWTTIDMDEMVNIIESIDVEARDRSNDYLQKFAHRHAAYGDAGTLPIYLAECTRTHPSYESAICYVELASGALLSESRAEMFSQAGFSARYLMEALLALRVVFNPSPWESELHDLGDRFVAVTALMPEPPSGAGAP